MSPYLRRPIALVFCALAARLLASDAPAEGAPRASLQLASARAEAGERVEATLSASWNPRTLEFLRLELPPNDGATSWTLALADPSRPLKPSARRGELAAALAVQGWEFGELEVVGAKVLLRPLDHGELVEAPVPPVRLEVVPSSSFAAHWKVDEETGQPVVANAERLPPPAEARGSIGPPPTWWERNSRRVGAALALLAAAWLAFRLVQWARRPKPEYIPAPEEWALGELATLARAPLGTPEAVEEFHFRLAEVLRLYCGRRWAFFSAKMTTSELAASLARLAPDLADDRRAELTALLEEADLVKFANYPAAKLTCQERLAVGRSFVESTAATAAGIEGGDSRENGGGGGAPREARRARMAEEAAAASARS